MAFSNAKISLLAMEFFSAVVLSFLIWMNFKQEELLTAAAYICMLLQILGQLESDLELKIDCILFTHIRFLAFVTTLNLWNFNFFSNFSRFKETKVGTGIKVLCGICWTVMVVLYAVMLYYEIASAHEIQHQIGGQCHREVMFTSITKIIVLLSFAVTVTTSCLTYCYNTSATQTKDDKFWISLWQLIAVNVTWIIVGVAALITDRVEGNTAQVSHLWFLPISMNGTLVWLIQYATPKIIKSWRKRTPTADPEVGLIPQTNDNNNVNDRRNPISRENVTQLRQFYEKLSAEANGTS